MKKVDLVVSGGRIFYRGEFIEAGIAVEGGRIVKIARKASLPQADERVNAEGLYVLPGAIDIHVHVRDLKQKKKEDWRTASEAAAAGGFTTILAMPNTDPPITTVKRLEDYEKIAGSRSIVDYGVYIGATGENALDVKAAREACAVKVYMGASTGELLVDDDASLSNAFKAAREAGKLVCVHAEDEKRIQERTALVKKKKRDVSPEVHSQIRDNECARIAVERAIKNSAKIGNRLHVCHVSTREELLRIVEARKKNVSVTCEVTPHHLFLSEKDQDTNSNRMKVNPPLRSRGDVSSLWGAVYDGVIDCVASDHAPHLLSEKEEDYWHAPAGFPGLETTMSLLLDAVGRSMLTLPQIVKLVSENPARIFGLKGKGAIKEGYDADLTVVDLKKSLCVRGENLKTRCRWTPFEGRVVKGVPCQTIVRGKTVYFDGSVSENTGREVVAT